MAGADPREIKLLTTAEVAAAFGVTATTVYQWTLNGCPSVIEKGHFLFRLKDIIAWKRGLK